MSKDRNSQREQLPSQRRPLYHDLSDSPARKRRKVVRSSRFSDRAALSAERCTNGVPLSGTFLDDKPQIVNPAYPTVPAPMGRVEAPNDVVQPVDLERYGVAATGWKPFWQWFIGIFQHDKAWWRRQISFLIVFAFLLVAAAFIMLDHWRRGVLILSGTALLTAAMRAFLPPDYMEMLEVRSPYFDVLFLLTVGTILLFLVVTVPA